MGPEQEKPQAKRARTSDAPLQQQIAPNRVSHVTPSAVPSCTTGITDALPPAAATASHNPTKPLRYVASLSAFSATPAEAPAPEVNVPTARPISAATAAAADSKPASFIADAHEAVRFRAVSAPTADALAAEIAAGGAPVSVEFLHQHFGDSEQIRGYSGLRITIWIHVRTFHTWVDVQYGVRRPGADKLSAIFEGAFPSGYCQNQADFVAQATATAAALPDLMSLGECVGGFELPATVYGTRATAGAAMAVDGESATGSVHVSVRRFQISTAPPDVKALHGRLEPLLLFTIDGANFIDDEDPQWEMLLPVLRAEDGGCLVLGITTLFNFFAYPASCRLRVSQVLVLSPWQGLGLGKALLKLSYDLAQSRGCADLTVEDPTPNLQRVREKLEVEMLRQLDWVAEQADKCLDAVSRGETTWPAWEAPEALPPHQPHQEGQVLTGVAADSKGSAEEVKPRSAAAVGAATADGAAGPSGAAAAVGAAGPSGAATADGAAGASGAGGGEQQQPAELEGAAASHAFFSVLGAGVAPERMRLPEGVQGEAAAAAEVRWRKRLEEAEAAATASAAEAPAADATAAVTDCAAPAAATVPAAASPLAAAAVAAPATVALPSSALTPSSAFVAAVSKQLKMHRGQVRVVWEALLWHMPGALRRPGVRAALEQLVSSRLESLHFSSVGRAAAVKRLVDIPKPKDGDPDKDTDFFLYRPMTAPPAAVAAKAADGAAGSGGGGPVPAAAVDTGAVAIGRLNLTQVSADDKVRRMSELLQERRQQLESLAAALNVPQKKRKGPLPK